MQAAHYHSPEQNFAITQRTLVERVRNACHHYEVGHIDVFDAADMIETVLGDVYTTEMMTFGEFRLPAPLQRLDPVPSVPMYYALGCMRRSMELNGTLLPPRERPALRRSQRGLRPSPYVPLRRPPPPERQRVASSATPFLACRVAARYGCTIRLWFGDGIAGPPRVFAPPTEPTRPPAPIHLLYAQGHYHVLRSGAGRPNDRLPAVLPGSGPGRGLALALMFALNIGNLQGVMTGLGVRSINDGLIEMSSAMLGLETIAARAHQSASDTFRDLLIACWLRELQFDLPDVEHISSVRSPTGR